MQARCPPFLRALTFFGVEKPGSTPETHPILAQYARTEVPQLYSRTNWHSAGALTAMQSATVTTSDTLLTEPPLTPAQIGRLHVALVLHGATS